MYLPDFLEAYRASCERYLRTGLIGDVNFSGPTYQVEVLDEATKEPYWVFVQLENNLVKDVFCSCEESSQKGACEHMSAACHFIFLKKRAPAHERFEHSFWREFFFLCMKKCGIKPPRITKEKEKWSVKSDDGELLFTAKGPLKSILEEKKVETEETSIKFSNLSEEELDLWRKGHPGLSLRFELSFLSDLAKQLFIRKEKGENYSIQFYEKVGKNGSIHIPDGVEITFSDSTITAPLNQEELLTIIPTLVDEKSSLSFFQDQSGSIESISFTPKTLFTVTYAKGASKDIAGAVSIGPYRYVPKTGFYLPRGVSGSVPERVVHFQEPKKISQLLNDSLDLVKEHLRGYSFADTPHLLQYQVFLDTAYTLHVEAYLFQPNDISHHFEDWVFSEKNKKFFKIEAPKFTELSFTVPRESLSPFLLQHRTWLSLFPGFEVHVSKVQGELFYEIDSSGAITFTQKTEKVSKKVAEVDLGDWIYRKNEGFFLKETFLEKPPLPIGQPISKHLVADFIRRNSDLLQSIPGFFSETCPVKNVGLNISLKKKGLIEIAPQYEWVHDKDRLVALFYDEFVFVPKKGFYRLPATLRPLHYIREISSHDSHLWNNFFLELLPKLKSEYTCYIDPRLEFVDRLSLVAKPLQTGSKHTHEWDLDLFFKSKDAEVKLPELIASLRRGERFFPTALGTVDLTQDRFHWLKSMQARKSQKLKKGFRLSSVDFFRIQAYESITFDCADNQKVLLERLLQLVPPEPPDYTELQCDLRPYQKNGVEWLWFLYQNGLSGLLCDDMGVGKTHQAMSLIASIQKWQKRQHGARALFLVVCPTSLIYHWEEKLNKFLPKLKIKSYIGAARTLDDFPGEYDIVLTTYGIWRNESRKFRPFFFEAAFFDELQIAKNHVSQIYAALLDSRSRMKVGLTGTPIENQLRELKALFDLVLPGYMPDDGDFREFFVRPIEKEENSERRSLLARFVKPFILRRRKQDVLPDLPEKTEDMCYVELAGEQKTLYKSVAAQQALPLIQLLKDEAAPIPYMHIFALLASLKQICNHPASYLKDVANYERYESGKWDAFIELIEEAEESDQKVVVFSQYLAMLDIMEAFLTKSGISFAAIRGQTKLRGDEIERFHKDPNCRVFLGSLQAAGLGIDLTAASVVIHYDRWWNAARENQATDRVHRIGQVRGVQVFKLITKHTVEEKIDQMILKKKNLLEDIVAIDDHQVVKKLSRHEILSLLEGLGRDA